MKAKPISILIADDNDMMRGLLRGILRSDDKYEVVGEASNGQAAVDMVERLQPNIACLDVMMPEMSGLDALREIKQRFPHVAVVMVTGNASPENVQESLQNGAVGFIVKPFNAAGILKTIEKVRLQLKPMPVKATATAKPPTTQQ